MGIGDTYVFGHEESEQKEDSEQRSMRRKMILITLIREEQNKLIMSDPTSYDSSYYKELEELKVKIKDAN